MKLIAATIMSKVYAITAAFVIYITCASAQNYLSRGWKLQDLSKYPDIVWKLNKVANSVSGSSAFTGYNVLALYNQFDAYFGQKYFAIYQDGTDTPCRLSWTDQGRGNPPADISGPNCGYDVCGGDDDSYLGRYSASRAKRRGR